MIILFKEFINQNKFTASGTLKWDSSISAQDRVMNARVNGMNAPQIDYHWMARKDARTRRKKKEEGRSVI
jgi:hypothetical protein